MGQQATFLGTRGRPLAFTGLALAALAALGPLTARAEDPNVEKIEIGDIDIRSLLDLSVESVTRRPGLASQAPAYRLRHDRARPAEPRLQDPGRGARLRARASSRTPATSRRSACAAWACWATSPPASWPWWTATPSPTRSAATSGAASRCRSPPWSGSRSSRGRSAASTGRAPSWAWSTSSPRARPPGGQAWAGTRGRAGLGAGRRGHRGLAGPGRRGLRPGRRRRPVVEGARLDLPVRRGDHRPGDRVGWDGIQGPDRLRPASSGATPPWRPGAGTCSATCPASRPSRSWAPWRCPARPASPRRPGSSA